jgi:putative aldouronate transport system substrate-binding protein
MAAFLLLGLIPMAMAQTAEPGWKQDTSPVTLTWFVDANWYANRWNTKNAEYITKKTGVTIDFVVPAGDTNQRTRTTGSGGPTAARSRSRS